MPFNDPPPMPGLGTPLEDLIRRIERIEGRLNNLQNSSIVATDTAGKVRMVIGALDGPPATKWGVQIFDPNGNEEVRLGQLDGTPAIYGLAVAPSTGSTPGTLQQVGGFLGVQAPDANSVSNTTPSSFGSPSSVTAMVGPSGQVALMVRSYITTSGGGVYGEIGISIDGGAMQTQLIAGASGGAVGETVSTTRLIGGLSAGTHTFQLQYQVVSPGTASMQGTYLTIQPL